MTKKYKIIIQEERVEEVEANSMQEALQKLASRKPLPDAPKGAVPEEESKPVFDPSSLVQDWGNQTCYTFLAIIPSVPAVFSICSEPYRSNS